MISPHRALAKLVFKDLCGPVKAMDARIINRKAERATILTASPYKKFTEDKVKEKNNNKLK